MSVISEFRAFGMFDLLSALCALNGIAGYAKVRLKRVEERKILFDEIGKIANTFKTTLTATAIKYI
ncbi:MAG: hypothetical protein O7G31_08640 [Calditrichaeota bacterium]|nr:hypothetical protein [Calditrichota bacterium]